MIVLLGILTIILSAILYKNKTDKLWDYENREV